MEKLKPEEAKKAIDLFGHRLDREIAQYMINTVHNTINNEIIHNRGITSRRKR